MSALRHALMLSLVFAALLSTSAFAAENAVPAGSRIESPAAPGSPAAAGFLAEISCSPDRSVALPPAPLPMVAPFPPVRCGVCSEPECVGLTRGESCGSNPDYVCGWSGRCTEDNLSLCTCDILQPI